MRRVPWKRGVKEFCTPSNTCIRRPSLFRETGAFLFQVPQWQSNPEVELAKRNYKYEKRQNEIAKKKKEEKEQRKLARKQETNGETEETPSGGLEEMDP
ncbi:hypothetical protein [Oceanidesulfovibrio indonesiensis]|uniref:hypothetical protein n=1 Tax=Oceanidesulfovibrio indonesiensis TaxID=54767 RepID=UPI0011859658|nr:hypothetical protein [Oceanidesulfovibrio indonesiensis]